MYIPYKWVPARRESEAFENIRIKRQLYGIMLLGTLMIIVRAFLTGTTLDISGNVSILFPAELVW